MNTKTITSGAEIKNAPQQIPAKLENDSKSNVAETSAKSATQAAVSAVVQPPKGKAMAKEEFNEKRYAELHTKSATDLGLDDAEHDEYVKLMGQRRAGLAAKRKELDTLVDSFTKSEVTFADFYKAVVAKNDGKRAEITSLFTAEEIKAAAGKGMAGKGPKAPKKDSTGVLLKIKEEGKLGKPTTYSKGQAIQTPQKAFRAIYEKDTKNFAENLKQYYQPGAAEYFETDAGKEELKKFIEKTSRNVSTRSKTS